MTAAREGGATAVHDAAFAAERDAQIDKLTADLVSAYETLTLVYRTVSNLGTLFRLEDITAYLVNRAVEAVDAVAAGLYLSGSAAGLELVEERGDFRRKIDGSAARRLADAGKPFFCSSLDAAEYLAPSAASGVQLMSSPLETGGRNLGLLVLLRSDAEPFTTGDSKLVAALCGVSAVAVANFQHYRAVNYEREMLESVIREIGDGIVVADERWRSQLTNSVARTFFAMTEQDAEGFDVVERLAAFRLSIAAEELREETGGLAEFFAESTDPRRPLVLGCKSFAARFGADGKPIRVLRMRDATRERRQAEAQRDFMSLASHKLRTPLTKILGLLPIARDAASPADLRHEAFDGIEQGGTDLARLVEGVLQFVEFRHGTAVRAVVDLGVLAREALAEVTERRAGRQIEAELRIDAHTPAIIASPWMMRTLFLHLLDNAVKFSSGPVARVAVRIGPTAGDRVQIAVVDHGEGIAPEVLQRLFAPFSQRDEDFTGQAEGAGLGLLLVREIVERHGGEIAAQSTLDVGSRFVALIPVAPREAEGAA